MLTPHISGPERLARRSLIAARSDQAAGGSTASLVNGVLPVRLSLLGIPRIVVCTALIATSLLALLAPLTTGTWSLQFLSAFPLAGGVSELYATATDPHLRVHPTAYATGIVALGAALLLFVSPSLVVNGVVVLLLALLAMDGAVKIGQAALGVGSTTSRLVTAVNAASSLLLALAGWWLWRKFGVEIAIGVVVAGYTAGAGWRMLLSPTQHQEDFGESMAANAHADPALALGEHEQFRVANALRASSAGVVGQVNTYWLLVIAAVLFATHVGRMRSTDSWLGLISPFVATAGDAIMAITLGTLLVLPYRLGWRRLTRPLERKAWQLRIAGQDEHMNALPRQLIKLWTDARFSFAASLRRARASLPSAAILTLSLGLPLTVLFAAINPIWGFSWYFNTESWASAFYQKVTALRVDKWRASMVDAVVAVHGGNIDELFRVTPPGIESEDFSFIVIGDPGEGDASQYALVDRYLALGGRDEIKFLVIASDVIYPAGAMVDYERNFYLPFKSFTKPIYAIPGNHDWFDALEGFNANFLEPNPARAALAARVAADLHLTSTNRTRIDHLLQRAGELRDLYGISNARQRAPFFELQTKDFAMIAIDTGILRTMDDRQRSWLSKALERSRSKFTMAIVGHPRYAAGQDAGENDPGIASLYTELEQAGVRVMMGGDTHAFEYYRAESPDRSPIHYFVNGGGGAYLSIGGALAWPDVIPTKTGPFIPAPKQSAPSSMPKLLPGSNRSGDGSNASVLGRCRSRLYRACSTSTVHPSTRASWKSASNVPKRGSCLRCTG